MNILSKRNVVPAATRQISTLGEGPSAIHELRSYRIVPALLPHYLRVVCDRLQTIRADRYGRLAGFWFSDAGAECGVYHLWEFPSLDARQELRAELAKVCDWQGFLKDVAPAIKSQHITFMRPLVPMAAPPVRGCLYELVRYRAAVGKAAVVAGEVLGQPFPRSITRVGTWTAESPDPNEIIQLLAIGDLTERISYFHNREQAAWRLKLCDEILDCHGTLLSPVKTSPLQ